jgi:hypothetical protein
VPGPSFAHANNARAPPTYPFHRICGCQRTAGTQMLSARDSRSFRLRLPAEHLPAQIDKSTCSIERMQVLSSLMSRCAM